jgi:MHS family proline/betaine transporter-like MFS transporter
VSLGVNIPVAIFGGGAPFVATWLIQWSGLTAAPAFYIMAAAVVSLVAVASLRASDLNPATAITPKRDSEPAAH